MEFPPTSQFAAWLLILSQQEYHVGVHAITLDMVVEITRRSAASQGRPFILEDPNSWMLRDPLGPTISIPVLTGARPIGATFCMRCVRTWRSTPLGRQPLCEFPHRRSNQTKCARCSDGHHACMNDRPWEAAERRAMSITIFRVMAWNPT